MQDKFKHPKDRNQRFQSKSPRFDDKKFEKNDKPGPLTYKKGEAFDQAYSPRGKWKILQDKRISFVDVAAKKSISPGPAKHVGSPKHLDKLSHTKLSPFSSRKRL